MLSDDRLRQMLSSVADAPTPSPDFVDHLWEVLERERKAPAARWRSVALPLAATLAALLLLVLGLLALSGQPSPPILGGVVGTIEVDGQSQTLLAADETVIYGWPANQGRLDTASMSLPATTHPYNDVAVGPAGWWVAGPDAVQRWYPSDAGGWEPAAPSIPVHATELGVGDADIAVRTNARDIVVFDAATGARTAAFEDWDAHDLGLAGGAVWFRSGPWSALHRLDLATGRELTPPIGTEAVASYVIGPDAVWVASGRSDRVFRLDPETGRVLAVIEVGLAPAAIAIDPDGYVWVAGSPDHAGPGVFLAWIDPSNETSHLGVLDVSTEIVLPESARPWEGNVFGLAVTRHAAWIGLAATSVDGTDPGTIYPMRVGSTIVRVAIDRTAD